MAYQVITSAILKCTFGAAPSTFIATPKMIQSNFLDAGNIMDHKPIMNIPPFGMCSCPSNPVVAAATTAAAGVLTLPWTPSA